MNIFTSQFSGEVCIDVILEGPSFGTKQYYSNSAANRLWAGIWNKVDVLIPH